MTEINSPAPERNLGAVSAIRPKGDTMSIRQYILLALTIIIPASKAHAIAGFDSHKIYGAWIATVKTDAMTDEVIKSAISINRTDKMNTRILIVECHSDGELAVFLSTDRFINLQNRPVEIMYRFNDEPPIKHSWHITSNDVTSLINTASKKEVKSLINDLSSKSGNIKIRYQDADGTDYNVTFPLRGSTQALKETASSC